MPNIINITQVRNNLSSLIKDVFLQKKTYILIRDSIPQAVISPYEDYQAKEEEWKKEMQSLMTKGKKIFTKYLSRKKMKTPKSENETYKIIDKVAGRY